MFLVHQAQLDPEDTQVPQDLQENQVMEALGSKESQGCQDHQEYQPLGSQACQACRANQGREDHMDTREILDQLAYQALGALQDYLESLAQLEFPCQENLDSRDLQVPQDPGAFLEKRGHEEPLV